MKLKYDFSQKPMFEVDSVNLIKCKDDLIMREDGCLGSWQLIQYESQTSFLSYSSTQNLFKSLRPDSINENDFNHLIMPPYFDLDIKSTCLLGERPSQRTYRYRSKDLQNQKKQYLYGCNCPKYLQDCCSFCKSRKQINGNSNMIKFLQYVINFKLGSNPSYTASTKIEEDMLLQSEYCYNLKKKSNSSLESSKCSITERASLRSKRYAKSQFVREIKTQVAIHHNYCCDLCHNAPIIGSRYHCSECQDYDECQSCHGESDHKHLMEKLDRSGKGKQLESMAHILAKTLGRKSLRIATSIKYLEESQIASR